MDYIVKKLFEHRLSLYESEATPDEMYEEYLNTHINGVKNIYHEKLEPVLIKEGVPDGTLEIIERHIATHDASKYSSEEWAAYRNHFYDPKGHPRSNSTEFDIAWNHHQKSNPHHWNYWCLINDVDEPKIHPLDMPLEYIIEMLCDWESAGNYYGNDANSWYEKQKDKMILSDNTRELVEKYLDYLK